jgi:hypothetical protein
MAVKFRMCDADREQFGGPEWALFQDSDYLDMRASALMKLEEALGMPLGSAMREFARGTTVGAKAILWLARHRAGVTETFDEFDPRVLALQVETVEDPEDGGDAGDPPARTSPQPGGQEDPPTD